MSLNVFVTTDHTRLSDMLYRDEGGHPFAATAVFRASSGMVGFGTAEALPLFQDLLAESVLIDHADSPAYRLVTTARDATPFGHRWLACRQASPEILDALRRVELNRKIASQNQILLKHGRVARASVPTLLSIILHDDNHLSQDAIAFLMGNSQGVSLWGHSEFGLYATFLGDNQERALNHLLHACCKHNIPIVQVDSQQELPVW